MFCKSLEITVCQNTLVICNIKKYTVNCLKVKEVAPHTAVSEDTEMFWKKDVPVIVFLSSFVVENNLL